jgi:UDP-sugar transporter A1/2/3
VYSCCITRSNLTVLKYADAVLKGYATAISVIFDWNQQHGIFWYQIEYSSLLGFGNVICAVLLYSSKDLDQLLFKLIILSSN